MFLISMAFLTQLSGPAPPQPLPDDANRPPPPILMVPPVERRTGPRPPAGPPQVIEKPKWITRPSGDSVDRYYPDLALRLAISGRAVIECRVLVTGLVEDCSVVEESPRGLGFGAAALRFTPAFRLSPQRNDGVAVGGARIRVPIAFTAPLEPPWEGELTFSQAVFCVHWHRSRLSFLPGDAESVRGMEQFSALARKLGPAAGLDDKAVGSALTGTLAPSPDAVRSTDAPAPADFCRLVV